MRSIIIGSRNRQPFSERQRLESSIDNSVVFRTHPLGSEPVLMLELCIAIRI